jgi:hypothetical protein
MYRAQKLSSLTYDHRTLKTSSPVRSIKCLSSYCLRLVCFSCCLETGVGGHGVCRAKAEPGAFYGVRPNCAAYHDLAYNFQQSIKQQCLFDNSQVLDTANHYLRYNIVLRRMIDSSTCTVKVARSICLSLIRLQAISILSINLLAIFVK